MSESTTEGKALYDRLGCIYRRELDDRAISPGEAGYLLNVLDEAEAKPDLTYEQIVELHANEIIDKDEARAALGL